MSRSAKSSLETRWIPSPGTPRWGWISVSRTEPQILKAPLSHSPLEEELKRVSVSVEGNTTAQIGYRRPSTDLQVQAPLPLEEGAKPTHHHLPSRNAIAEARTPCRCRNRPRRPGSSPCADFTGLRPQKNRHQYRLRPRRRSQQPFDVRRRSPRRGRGSQWRPLLWPQRQTVGYHAQLHPA